MNFRRDEKKTAIEELRHMVKNFNYCRENFLDQFDTEELLQLHRAHQKCGWDFFPDGWTAWQIEDVLERGLVPQWSRDEEPQPYDLKNLLSSSESLVMQIHQHD